ncbi:hypothetical protein AGABI2DRAFT_47748, partial [Agaricus bisporus var. bisporus H97]|uniref:hypothetical protein n=1 Tax=Agaricus bisporus var. bisporus (strain H97 / ATCC MYA-4626 / FGSC 10389) TaxID=936046 RepID=UPI00029F58C9
DSDDDNDWEEVEFPELQDRTIEITLNAQPKAGEDKQKRGLSHAERILRIDCHKIHTICLLTNAWVRNKYLNDELLHARLLSICPLKYQDSFATIHKSRIPDPNQRGRMFENAVRDLASWWSSAFEVVPEGHLRNRTFLDVEKVLERYHLLSNDDDSVNGEMDVEVLQDVLDEDGEFIRTPKSLMKHALMARGSRDTSAQLFTALCRALGIPARLVASLQSVPWQASVGKPKPKYEKKTKGKKKGKATASESTSVASEGGESENEDDIKEMGASTPTRESKGKGKATDFPGSGQRLDGGSMSAKAKGKQKARPPIKLRKARPKGRTLGSLSPTSDASPLPLDPTTTPPVFWTEVFSKPDGRWLPVDPIRNIVNKRKVFDPTPSSINTPPNTAKPSRTQQNAENRLLYVLAFEEDGFARDVTRRYARDYSTKVVKAQGGSGAANMGGRRAWWGHVLSIVHRPYRLHRDDIEDEELETAQMLEGMPTTMTGFKDHPVYVLIRHLKQNETLYPPPPSTPELGKFRGEPVYPRSAVVSLKTAENWMRNEGRTIKTGEQPLKMVKVRAGTVNKLRELEVLKEAGGSGEGNSGDAMQGLYARLQTELYIPDPVVDGIIPKNNFGNIDLYTPSMLPQGAAHIPYKGVAKVARNLGFDFAEAVTGFEFKKRRAYPVLEGVVIAKENEDTLLEAFWEFERIAEARAQVKREERVLKQWKRLIQGLRIRQRLQEQYGTTPGVVGEGGEVDKGQEGKVEISRRDDNHNAKEPSEHDHHDFIEADDVVQAFHLPKFQHVPDAPVVSFHHQQHSSKSLERGEENLMRAIPDFVTYDLDNEDEQNVEHRHIIPLNLRDASNNNNNNTTENPTSMMIPKTMAQFAEDAAAQQEVDLQVLTEDITSVTSVNGNEVERLRRGKVRKLSSSAAPTTMNVRTTGQRHRNMLGRTTMGGRKRKQGDEDDFLSDDDNDEDESKRTTNPTSTSTTTTITRKRRKKDVPVSTRTLRPRRSKS